MQVGGRGQLVYGEVTADRKRCDTFTSSPAESTTRSPLNACPVGSVEAVQGSSAILSPFFFLQVTSLPAATRELQISGFDTQVVQKQEKSWES